MRKLLSAAAVLAVCVFSLPAADPPYNKFDPNSTSVAGGWDEDDGWWLWVVADFQGQADEKYFVDLTAIPDPGAADPADLPWQNFAAGPGKTFTADETGKVGVSINWVNGPPAAEQGWAWRLRVWYEGGDGPPIDTLYGYYSLVP